jgi:hypothetical protein
MLIVGSSTSILGNASGLAKSTIESPISKSSIPTTAHKSPLLNVETFNFPNQSKTKIFLLGPVSKMSITAVLKCISL